MTSDDSSSASGATGANGEQPAVNPDRVGIYLDVMDKIIRDLNDNEQLRRIFGEPVERSLVVVADDNDLRIEGGPDVALDEDETKTFLRVLDEVIRANSG